MRRPPRHVGLAIAWVELLRLGAGPLAQSTGGRDPGSTVQSPSPALTFHVDTRTSLGPISPFIYGSNTIDAVARLAPQITLGRMSGNRLTTYNWENNYSNAGKHSGHINEATMVVDPAHNLPAAAALAHIDVARGAGARDIITVPAMGWVSRDADGVVPPGAAVASRFIPSLPRKPGSFGDAPDLNDDAVYQDEFAHYLAVHEPDMVHGGRVWFCIDNEPSLWALNFPRAHPDGPTYAEVIGKNIDYAAAIKDVVPGAFINGLVAYGWDELATLQKAPDRFDAQYAGRSFIEVYLDSMRRAEQEQGRRLIDALDLHWYPEARGGGVRITSHDASPALVAARLQAPRSLWDPTYIEDSWITDNTRAPIVFLPWIHDLIDQHYPGTKLVVSEYNFGGGADISGALAEADVLGLFGRGGVYAAALWELDEADHSMVYAAMAMYRDFDGQGGAFGDEAVATTTSDAAIGSLYAARDSASPGRLTLVVVNKAERWQPAEVHIAAEARYTRARAFVLSRAKAAPVAIGDVPVESGVISVSMPAMSVMTFELLP